MSPYIAVLSNPVAGKGRGRAVTEAAITELRARGAEVREYVGSSAADTVKLAAQVLRDDPTMLVVVGGDGTLSEILRAALDSDVPLALIPAGTGNDLARALGIPRADPVAAAALAITGIPRLIDVGEMHCNGRVTHFLTIAALGFDAKVSARTNQLRWPRGALRYYLAMVIEFLKWRPIDFRLAVDGGGTEHAPGTVLAVGNTDTYGGGIPVCTGANPADGALDVVHVAPIKRLRLIRLFSLMLRGRHLVRPEVTHRRAHTVRVAAPGLTIYADGEFVGVDECTITVRPATLRIMVPHLTNT